MRYFNYDMMGNGTEWIFMFGILVLTIVIVFALFYYLKQTKGLDERSKSTLDLLNERYAKGEIDAAEYKKIKDQISK